AEDAVAPPVVPVYQRPAVGRREASREPAERELEGGVRLGGEGTEQRLVARELDGRGPRLVRQPCEEGEGRHAEVDRVDAGEGRGELLGKRGARRRVLGVAQETAGERLPLDVVHHEEGRAEREIGRASCRERG